MDCSTPGFPVHHKLPEFIQTHIIESVTPSNHLILCCPILLPPSVFPSIRVFSNESLLHIRWPKYWSFSFSISPSNDYSGLISFRIDWLDLLTIQGTLKSLLQHHSSNASILQHSAFFIVQLSHPYMTTGKTIALIRWTFAGKVVSPVAAVTNNHKLCGWKHQKCYSLTVLEAGSTGSLSLHWNQGVGRVTCIRGKCISCLSSFWWLSTFLGFWPLHSIL